MVAATPGGEHRLARLSLGIVAGSRYADANER